MTLRPRRVISVSLLVFLNLSLLLFGSGWSASLPADPPTVTLNGSPLAAGVAPLIVKDQVLFPVRPLAEALSASVTWDAKRRKVTITRGERTIILRVGRTSARLDGRQVRLKTTPVLSKGQTLVPLRFVSESLGAAVAWDPATRTVSITHPEGASPDKQEDAPATKQDDASTTNQGDLPAPTPQQGSPDPASIVPPAPRAGRHLVLAYAPVDWQGDTMALRSLQVYGDNIDTVAYFGLSLDRYGNLSNPGGDGRELMDAARRGGQAMLLTVHNMRSGTFDRAGVHALLNDTVARTRAVENIYHAAREGGYAGINLDIEALDPADRNQYTSFVRSLADRLRPAGLAVTLAVPAKTGDDRWNLWSGGFDYTGLGELADALVIMAYDEHWAGGPPGPVASIGWAERVARYVADTIPKEKVLFGIAGYGYDWVQATGETIALSAPSAANKAARFGVSIRWDDDARVPYFAYADGRGRQHTVYYENASSMEAKVDLVTRHGFAGIALWRLGLEDPAVWQGVIKGKLR